MVDTPILLVDDDTAIVKTLADIFIKKGYPVYTAHNGYDAIDIVANKSTSLVISDIKMEGMNGFDLFRRIMEIRPQLPTIFITAYATDDLFDQLKNEGVENILIKPLDIDDMLTRVSGLLSTAHS